jgi:ubiquinol-cytochrome c reductase cytochrome b subunit
VLTLSYSPATDNAYESVKYISEQLTLGWFVRGLHYWSAGLMVVMLFFHLFRLILLGSYKLPREGIWYIGIPMFFLILGMAFTGYLLRWDERAVYGMQVLVAMLDRVWYFGESLVWLLLAGEQVNALTLTRLYALHVVVVPLLLVALTTYHLYLVVLRGTTSKSERERVIRTVEEQERVYERDARTEERGDLFYPETVLKSGAFAVVVLAIVVGLVLVWGAPSLDQKANLTDPARPAEEWWFWWYSALVALLPSSVVPTFVVLFPLAVFLALMLLPMLDRGPQRGWQNRPVAVGFVIVSVVALLWLSWIRYRSPWTGWPSPAPPPVPVGMTLSSGAEEGRQLFARYGCTSCHPIAGHGSRVGTDLARLERVSSRAEIGNYILQPPRHVAMPGYAGRLSGKELEHLIDFVHVVQTDSY